MDKAGQYARLQGLMALRSSGFGHPTSRLSGSLKKSVLTDSTEFDQNQSSDVVCKHVLSSNSVE